MVLQELEWILLEAHFNLLEYLVQQPKGIEDWIKRRCDALSALIRLVSIPPCKKLLDIQEKVCQLRVIATPCCSDALYRLGLAQLAQYDNDPDSKDAPPLIRDAQMTFQASINLENKPSSGPPLAEILNQQWWKDWEVKEKNIIIQKYQDINREGTSASVTSQSITDAPKGKLGTAKGGTSKAVKSNMPIQLKVPLSQRLASTKSSGASVAAPISTGRRGVLISPKNKTTSTSGMFVCGSQALSTSKVKPSCSPVEAKALLEKDEPKTMGSESSELVLINQPSPYYHLGLAQAYSRTEDKQEEACKLYSDIIKMAPEVNDAYIELASMLMKDNPLAAVDIYCKVPMKPVKEQTFNDAFITGEIVRILIKHEKYDHPKLASNMIAYGKVMGIGCLEKYIQILEGKFKTDLLKTVYAGIHDKSEDDEDLQTFFHFKCWI
ncbi:uncharacterized protein LOC127525947 [Erpetoichthys calabaricus]|uniref:uncharacterized protein LOC127525947 n=1 Tax=Erpetoichthys calabaricus TaxID=27687 RepID=UPI0022342D7E|nr:uncharacterized protein LOC127525947 [Erpetoichthys calabaricus]